MRTHLATRIRRRAPGRALGSTQVFAFFGALLVGLRLRRFLDLAAGAPVKLAAWPRRAVHLTYKRWQQLFGFDFFISYARREASDYAIALEKSLAQVGFRCFLDRTEFSPGDHLRAATESHLDNSSALVLVATPLALDSPHVQRELEYFLSLKRPVIPLSIGQAVESAPADGVVARSLQQLIWIPEAATQLPTGPSDSAVAALVHAVAITRRAARRLRVFTALSVFLLGLSVLAAYFAMAEHSARAIAEQRTRIATAQRLASEARMELQASPGRSLALAVESIQVTRSAGEPTLAVSEEALREVLAATGGVRAATHSGRINAIAVSPDGLFIASGGDDRVLRISDVGQPDSTPQEVRVHGDAIASVAYSVDGRWLATGSDDHTVMLLDRSTRGAANAPRVLRCHSAAVSQVAISNDSRWLASASFSDGTVCLWDLAARADLTEPVRITEHRRASSSSTPTLVFSPDSQWLLTAFRHDPVARLWRTGSWLIRAPSVALPGHVEGLTSAAFAPDSATLVTADGEGTLRRWSAPRVQSEPPASPRVLARDTGAGDRLRISPDGKWLAAAASNRTVSLWRRGSDGALAFVSSLTGHDGNLVADIEFSDDSRYVATVGGTNILVWDLADATRGMTARVMRGHDRTVRDLLFLPTTRLLASAGDDAHVRLWGLDDEPVVLADHEHLSNDVYHDFDAAFSSDGRWVATSSRTLNVTRVWDMQARAPHPSPLLLEARPHLATRLAFSADGRRLFASDAQDYVKADAPGSIWVWPLDLAGNRAGAPWTIETGMALSVIGVSRTGEMIAASDDQGVSLWKVSDLGIVGTGKLRAPRVKALVFDPSGRRLLTGSATGEVRLWELEASGNLVSEHLLGNLKGDVRTVAVSDDGRRFAAAGFDNDALVWRQTGEGSFRQVVLGNHADWVSALALGDDSHLVTGTADGAARLWTEDSQGRSARFTELIGHDRSIMDAAIRGELIVTGSMDRTARLWRRDGDGNVTSVLLPGHRGYVRRVRISSDGARLLTASFDGGVRVWRTAVEDLLATADRRAVRNLCPAEWMRHMGHLDAYRATFPHLMAERFRHVESAVCKTSD